MICLCGSQSDAIMRIMECMWTALFQWDPCDKMVLPPIMWRWQQSKPCIIDSASLTHLEKDMMAAVESTIIITLPLAAYHSQLSSPSCSQWQSVAVWAVSGSLGMARPAEMQNLLSGSMGWAVVLMSLIILSFLTDKSRCSLQHVRSEIKKGDSLNFLVVGDWGRKGLYNQSRVAAQMGRIGEELDIDFVISTGDNFYENGLTGTDDPSFEESFSGIYTAKSLQTPWYSVLGNHDYRGNALAQLSPSLRSKDHRWQCQRSFLLRYTICPHGLQSGGGSADIFFIDTTPFVDHYWKPSKNTYDWRGVLPREKYLHQQLQDLQVALEASTATWKIVIGHHTIRSVGTHGDTEEMIQQILPIIQAYGVDLYMNGHDHCLEHISSVTSPLQFLTSGGGSRAWRGMKEGANMEGLQFFHNGQGFISVQIQATLLHVVFYDVAGNRVHELNLLKDSLSAS